MDGDAEFDALMEACQNGELTAVKVSLGARGNLVNGYSGKADMARLVNMFHVALLALGCKWYGEWVPSKANVADIMTRPERFHELLDGLRRELAGKGYPEDELLHGFELDLPSMDTAPGNLKGWWQHLREAAARQD